MDTVEKLEYADAIVMADWFDKSHEYICEDCLAAGVDEKTARERLLDHEEHILSLFTATSGCIYCGGKLSLESGYREFHGLYQYTPFAFRCSLCNWWYVYIQEGDFFHDLYQIGVLHRVTSIDASLHAAIRQILVESKTIYKLNPTSFEKQVGAIFKEFYNCDVIHVGKSHDGGIDLLLLDSNEGKIPVQVKRRGEGKIEAVSVVRDFLGAMLVAGYNRGIIVTSAHHFSRRAKQIAQLQPKYATPQYIDLIDCRRLLGMMGLLSGNKR